MLIPYLQQTVPNHNAAGILPLGMDYIFQDVSGSATKDRVQQC
jgi:hypothetical protein